MSKKSSKNRQTNSRPPGSQKGTPEPNPTGAGNGARDAAPPPRGAAGSSGARAAEDLSARVQELEQELLAWYGREQELEARKQELEEQRVRWEQGIRSDEAQVRRAYREEQEEQFRQAREVAGREAEACRDAAQEDADSIRQQAEAEAEAIMSQVEKEQRRLLDSAREEKAAAEAERADLLHAAAVEREALLAEARAQADKILAEEREQLKARQTEVRRRESDLEGQEEDLRWERKRLEERLAALEKHWQECSPEQVRVLGAQVERLEAYARTDSQTIARLQEENDRLRSLIPSQDGRSAESVLEELRNAQQRNRDLTDRLAQYPSADELQLLRAEAAEVTRLRDEKSTLFRRVEEVEARASRLSIGVRELEQARAEREALRVLNDALKKELEYHKSTLDRQYGERFPELVRLDSAPALPRPASHTRTDGLKALVEHIRRFAAAEEGLYYPIDTIRAFVAGLAASRLSVLQGLSGTGKTSLPRVVARAMGGQCAEVAVQSNWRDRYELLGYDNDFLKRFRETEFTKAVYSAGRPAHRDFLWFIVLDEMNLARVEYYFADFLSVLEQPQRDRWRVPLVEAVPRSQPESGPRGLIDGRFLPISPNVWFVGTANRDESTFEITDKVYDRAQVIEFADSHPAFPCEGPVEPAFVSASALEHAFEAAQQSDAWRLTADDRQFVRQLRTLVQERLGVSFGNRVEAQLEAFAPVFVASGGSRYQAIDWQFTRKVMRKLDGRHGYGLVRDLQELMAQIERARPEAWEEMTLTREALEGKIRTLESYAG